MDMNKDDGILVRRTHLPCAQLDARGCPLRGVVLPKTKELLRNNDKGIPKENGIYSWLAS